MRRFGAALLDNQLWAKDRPLPVILISSPEASTDTVAGRLGYFDTFEAGCYVHVAQNHFNDTRMAVVDELKRIAALGCSVKVAYGSMDTQPYTQLKAAGVDADYFEIDSENGHLASGVDADKWAPALRAFMAELMPKT